MKWVEKSSFEKIHRLLEISEQERHFQVLLTQHNISAVRNHPAPYTLPVIPRPLPSSVMNKENFMIADVRRLVSGGTSSSRNPVVAESSRVQGDQSASRSSTSSDEGLGWFSSVPDWRARGDFPERSLPLAQIIRPAP